MTTFFVEVIDDKQAAHFLELCRKHRHAVTIMPLGVIVTPALTSAENMRLDPHLTIPLIRKMCRALECIGVERTPATLTTGDVVRYFRRDRPLPAGTFWIVQVTGMGKTNLAKLTDYLHSLGLKWADER